MNAAADISLETEALLEEARCRTGLDDFGPEWFLEGMEIFLKAARTEARCIPEGCRQRIQSIVRGLVNRLEMFDHVKRYPEILEETLNVAGGVVGLPRTGSTMMHRLLGAGPNMAAVRSWELASLAPLLGEEPARWQLRDPPEPGTAHGRPKLAADRAKHIQRGHPREFLSVSRSVTVRGDDRAHRRAFSTRAAFGRIH